MVDTDRRHQSCVSTMSEDVATILGRQSKRSLKRLCGENDIAISERDIRQEKDDLIRYILHSPSTKIQQVVDKIKTAEQAANNDDVLTALKPFTQKQIIAVCERQGITLSSYARRAKPLMAARLSKLSEREYEQVLMDLKSSSKKRARSETGSLPAAKKIALDDEGKDTDFLSLPTEQERQELVKDFIARTEAPRIAHAVCCICARETMKEDTVNISPNEIPNGSTLLCPDKQHPAHVLTSGMLLHRTEKGTVPRSACTDCLTKMKANMRPAMALANHMWIGDMPFQLRILTLPERILISRYFAVAYIVKMYPKKKSARNLPSDMVNRALKGNVSSYVLNTQAIAGMVDEGELPPRPEILAATIGVTFIGRNNKPLTHMKSFLRVRRERVADALEWLIANNPIYSGIKISRRNLNQLPSNGIPDSILQNMAWKENDENADHEQSGYVPEDDEEDLTQIVDNIERGSETQIENDRAGEDRDEELIDGEQDTGESADVIPLQAHGVVDVDGNGISQTELLTHALRNIAKEAHSNAVPDGQPDDRQYYVRSGGFANEYPRRDSEGQLSIGEPDNPNHMLGCFPVLFPYGEGGLETNRKQHLTYQQHVRWALQYADRRFRKDLHFVFQAFSVIQKREICERAAFCMTRAQFRRYRSQIEKLTPEDFRQAAEEEARKAPYHNPVMRALVSQLSAVRSQVMGTNQSRTSVRSQVWSLCAAYNPPSIWLTLNPTDIHNPIAQVFAGEDIDFQKLDSVLKRSTAIPGAQQNSSDSTRRTKKIAEDPYAAAKFFHFTVKTTLETLFGIKASNGRIERHKGIFGVVKAYVGMVEAQGRGTLHLHMLLFLNGAPSPSTMADLLKSSAFRQKFVDFIRANIVGDVGLSAAELQQLPKSTAISYARPINPEESGYRDDVNNQQKYLVRALQLHDCEIGRCLVVKKGKLRCKNRAPWELAENDWIDETGKWGMKRQIPYLNAFNPTILETQFCNHDVKIITNGDETMDRTMYFTTYATKKRDRSSNESAVIGKRFSLHQKQERKNPDYEQTGKLLITRCAIALNREMEFGAPEIISYLMGWGDRYISHLFVPIYLDGLFSAVRAVYPGLQQRRWRSFIDSDGSKKVISEMTDTEGEIQTVTLRMESGRLDTKDQLTGYRNRGESLEQFSVLEYFRDTYEEHESKVREGGARGPVPKTRHRYREGYRSSFRRVVRSAGHETVPNFVGRWFPRNDTKEDRLQYVLMMLTLLKPWREVSDITRGFTTAEEAWAAFIEQSNGAHSAFLENVQYYHRSSDLSRRRQDAQKSTDLADATTTTHDEEDVDGEIEDGNDGRLLNGEGWTEAEIVAAQDAESGPDARYGTTALECAYDSGIFKRWYELDTDAPFADRSTPEDKVNFQQWGTALKEYAAGGGVIEQNVLAGAATVLTNLPRPANEAAVVVDGASSTNTTPSMRSILNEEQGLAYDIVMDHLRARLELKNIPPLRMVLQGAGGTGKTVVINAITEGFQLQGEEKKLARTATSGVAATLISGRTVHTWAGLPLISPKGNNWIAGSTATAQKRLANMTNVEYLIVDEMSMATKDMLCYLSDITNHVRGTLEKPGTGDYFGGLNVILCGDFHQFPPVGNPHGALYDSRCKTPSSSQGLDIFTTFTTVVTLKKQVRVTDGRWVEFLDRLRTGSCISTDIDILNDLRLDLPTAKVPDFTLPRWKAAVLITPRNSARKRWNAAALRQHCADTKERLYSAPAEDTVRHDSLSMNERMLIATRKQKQCGNLPHRVEIAVGMHAMVMLNVATEADLANGTRGIITKIVLDDREREELDVVDGITVLSYPPAAVFFEPRNKTEVTLPGVENGILPIIPSEATFKIAADSGKSKSVKRRQIPITGAYAFTDYKGQGQTIENVVVDLQCPASGNAVTSFSAYVSLSRSRGRETIRLLRGFDENIFVNHPSEALREADIVMEKLAQETEMMWRNGIRF